MARSTSQQANFNAGEISRRLRARSDLNIYGIALSECVGWAPLVEGGLDAIPGTIRVAEAAGPCRLIPFETLATQGYLIEASHQLARFYTNDARIERDGAPVELALPYTFDQVLGLNWEQSYDVLYLFHRARQTRQLVRVGPDDFDLEKLELENGPFEDRNRDESLIVSASATQGNVTLQANEDLFELGDVGGLFQLEADDFGDISSWEPGITVTVGQLLTWNERVYSVVGGSGRTGTVAPIHGKGVEWDGIGRGKDLNDKDAGGVQLQYMHDRFGILKITAFTSPTMVTATVLRTLPFTAATSYAYDGGYYGGEYVPPDDAVDYAFGTWRWRFGAFSDRRGWPTCGVLWNERLVLFKDANGYASVAGALADHATYNELGDISADMAFRFTLPDPNPITGAIAGEKLVMISAGGAFALGPSNAANGVGPNNFRIERQNNEGGSAARPVELDGRALYIGKGKRRVLEGSYQVQRDREEAIDLTRYARHIGVPKFTALVSTKDPARLVWAVRGDGTLAGATYVPEETVLGWFRRSMAPGVAARSIAAISDPAGELDQLWSAVEWNGNWHILLHGQFRQEGDATDPPMVDLAAEYAGDPASLFGPVPWLAGQSVHVLADSRAGPGRAYTDITIDDGGMFTLPEPASHVWVGLPFEAAFTTLRPTNEGALGKMARTSRVYLDVLDARGLDVSVAGDAWIPVEQLQTTSEMDEGFEPDSDIRICEDVGDWGRHGTLSVRRSAPTAATMRAVIPMTEISLW